MNVIVTVGLAIASIAYPGFVRENSEFKPEPVTLAQNREDTAQVREHIQKSVPLARGATVNVRGLNGALTVETWDGEAAEIDILVTASDQEALTRRPLLVEGGGSSLTIRTDERKEMGRERGDRSWVRHRAHLRLPRSISFNVSGINGHLKVGDITGAISISGINGGVEVAEAGSAAEIKGVNGHVTVSLSRLAAEGLTVSGINGGVEIGFTSGVNAALDVHGINGGVSSDFALTVIGEMKRGELRGTIGSGGPSITVKGINGGVQIKRR